jgi:hypothetical protein
LCRDVTFALACLAGAGRARLPVLAEETSSAISRLFELAFQSTDLRLISVTIDLIRGPIVTAADNPDRAAVLCNPGGRLHQRFDLTGELALESNLMSSLTPRRWRSEHFMTPVPG